MILVFGKTGQLARALQSHAGVTALERDAADLSDPQACAAAITAHRPRAVINAAAYTAVDRAEDEEPLATRINADSPGAMARACVAQGIPLVHVSTDYVFDGSGDQPRLPDAPTAPLNAYGRSKLAGEQAVVQAGGAHAVIRTAWVVSGGGANFVTTMLRLGATRDALSVVGDQIGGPTPADALAEACLAAVQGLLRDPALAGVYHYSGAPEVSWADLARAIMQTAGLSCEITDIASEAWPTPAARPRNSRLDCSGFETSFGLPRPDWRAALPGMISSAQTA